MLSAGSEIIFEYQFSLRVFYNCHFICCIDKVSDEPLILICSYSEADGSRTCGELLDIRDA